MPGYRHSAIIVLLFLLSPLPASAAARDDLLARYADEARASDGGFTSFSAARGEKLYRERHTGGKPDTPSCTSCHGDNPREPGQTLTGKSIDPVAVSTSPTRYTDPAKVEKWFRRNCREVLGRECTATEKGDWITWMIKQ